jgi:hypothetical protein
MSRNIKKSTELIFDIIKLRFDLTSILPIEFNYPRWIYGDKLDEGWFADCKIPTTIEILRENRFGLIKYQNVNYFFSTGLEDPDILPNGLIPSVLNAGLFAAIVSDTELPIKTSVTNLQLEQSILSQNKNVPLYQGHDYNDLRKYFPNIYVAEITTQFIGDPNNLQQIICSYLALNKKFITLPFSDNTLHKINDLVLLNSSILSYDSIIQSMLSSTFKFAFLDMYRCIELLYQIIYVDDTYKNLSLTINRTIFLNAIDEKLNWKPNERNSLKKLFSETPEIHKREIVQTIKRISNVKQADNCSDWLYDLRCSIVHLKSTQKVFNLTPVDWDKLLFGIGHLTTYWYDKYRTFN